MFRLLESMDSILINVPLSSPLHIKANIIFLKSFIKENGFKIKAFDTNIHFFKWMLRDYDFNFHDHIYMDNPVKLLGLYNQIEEWRKEYNTHRPHSALGYLPPAPETIEAVQTVSTTLQLSVLS